VLLVGFIIRRDKEFSGITFYMLFHSCSVSIKLSMSIQLVECVKKLENPSPHFADFNVLEQYG